jgi:preprotein translocase subunit SecB
MDSTNTPQPAFKINQIILTESIFKRETDLKTGHDLKNKVSVELGVKIIESNIYVTETVNYSQEFEGKNVVEAKIVMLGHFEKIGNPSQTLESFGNINGAAIIFPFLREHLASLCIKSGIGIILLPPINFDQMYKDGKNKIATP